MALDVNLYKPYIAERHLIGTHGPYSELLDSVRWKFSQLIFWLDRAPASVRNAVYHWNAQGGVALQG